MGISTKSNEEANRQSAGYNGTRPLSGTTEKECVAMGYIADSDTIFESIKDSNGTEKIVEIGYNGWTLKAGYECFFGFVTSSIKLQSGSGQYYLAE